MNIFVPCLSFFFFNDTATTEIYTLSLHDALPIWSILVGWCMLPAKALVVDDRARHRQLQPSLRRRVCPRGTCLLVPRSEEHTSELQSQSNLVCRLLLEKKKKKIKI